MHAGNISSTSAGIQGRRTGSFVSDFTRHRGGRGITAKKYTNHDVDSSSRGRRSRPVPPPPKCCGCSMRRGFCCWHRSILFHSMYCITHPSARDAANATHAVELHYLSCHEMYSKKKGSEFLIILSFQFYYLYIDRRSIPDSNVL